MKKLVLTAAVLGFAASMASAQVYSQNIVGYCKTEFVGGQLTLCAINFLTDDDGILVSELLPKESTPIGTYVYTWDKENMGYIVSFVTGRRVWSGDTALYFGDAFWVQSGAAAGVTNEVVVSGEVLLEDQVINLPIGLVATGYGYPVNKELKTTQIATDLANGSMIYTWDASSQGYAVLQKSARGTWSGSGAVSPGTGFWVNNNGAELNVTEPVPFTTE